MPAKRLRKKSAKGASVSLADFKVVADSEESSSDEISPVRKKSKAAATKAKTAQASLSNSKESTSSSKPKAKGVSVEKKTLLQQWMIEKVADEDSGSDYAAKKSKPRSRGSKQSKVPGEVTPVAHARERERRVKSYTPKRLLQLVKSVARLPGRCDDDVLQ